MYGAAPYASLPYGASGGVEPFDYAAMLESSRAELVYTVVLTTWEIGGSAETKLYLGSAEWATAPTDVPASTPFDGRLTTALQFSRTIVGDRIGACFQSGEGSITFLNPDGAYDAYLDDYTVAGRAVTVRVGRKTDAFADHLTIFDGQAVDWFGDNDTITITIRDPSFRLDVPTQADIYTGAGGAEGGADLADKRKPRVYGTTYGTVPTLIDGTNLVYQFSDKPTYLITAVYDRGVALTQGSDYASYAALIGASVSAGNYITCVADGMVRLGASADGVVFATVVELSANPTHDEIIAALVEDAAGFISDDLDRASFDRLNLVAGNPAAYFVDPSDPTTVAEAITRLMEGIRGGWAAFNRAGKLAVGSIGVFSGTTLTSLTSAPLKLSLTRDGGDIIDLNREKLPSGVWPPPWRIRVAEDRNFTIFDDFAGSVPESLKIFYSQPYRLLGAEDAGVLEDYPAAQDPSPVEGYWLDGAANEAAMMLALWNAGFKLYRMTVNRRALGLDLGDKINVTWPRFGLDAGKDMIVVGLEDRIDLSDGSAVDQVEVLAYG